MSRVNFLDKLLDGVAVEWKALGSVTTIKTGPSVNKQMISDNPGDYPVINSGREPLGFINEWNTEYDPIGITSRGAGVGSITWQEGKYFRGNLNYSVTINDRQKISTRYLYHLLLEMQSDIQALCTFDGIPALNAGNLKELQIPIPCPDNPKKSLEIQAEIVRILDAFTKLTAELTAELTARKKQYNYYRDQLLSFEAREVEWKSLGELFEFKNGINKEKEFFGRGDSIINYTDVYKKNKLFEGSFNGKVVASKSDIERFGCKKGDVFFTRTSETQDEIGYAAVLLSDIDVCVFSGFLIRARPVTDSLMPEYCAYCFSSMDVRKLIIASSNMTTRVTTTGTALSKIKIPIPSLAEQARIVAILDKFDALTNSLSEGLPREIELRQKQYEYYRDLLLSFPKPAEVAA